MRRYPKASLLLAGILVACDTGTGPDVPDLRVSSITLEARGDTARLVARSNGVVVAAEWESLDPSVVAVTAEGLATAVAAGSVGVRAVSGGLIGQGTITVLPPVNVQVSDLAVVTDLNGEQGMAVRIRNLGGRGLYRLEFWRRDPDGSARRVLSYASEAEARPGLDIEHRNFLGDELADWVVAFSREPLSDDPIRTGCARVDGVQEPCPDEPPGLPVQADSVAVWPAASVLSVGDTVQFIARAFSNGAELTNRSVVWSTPSPDVISISETGRVVALKAGYGQVNATVDGVTSAVALTVASEDPGDPEAPVRYVHLLPEHLRLWVGQRWNMEASAYDSSGRLLEGRSFSWGVEDGAVATVDSEGIMTATGQGRTRVAATSEGVSGYAVVESYARPTDAAQLAFRGLLPWGHDPSTAEPSIPTTWVDSAGVSHDAWIQIGPGSLAMTWAGGTGGYSQNLVLSTFVYRPGVGVRMVTQSEYVDHGTLERWWDFAEGREYFDFTSEATAGLAYRGTWTVPGELEVQQAVGTIGERSYHFRLTS